MFGGSEVYRVWGPGSEFVSAPLSSPLSGSNAHELFGSVLSPDPPLVEGHTFKRDQGRLGIGDGY